ncbi:MAG: RluA family pseudouridine synthase [Candidatus Eisenbacteria bacterium]|nr:RluA family pseudouridine synthase [Candidatus Eisenbacteria bacterium]
MSRPCRSQAPERARRPGRAKPVVRIRQPGPAEVALRLPRIAQGRCPVRHRLPVEAELSGQRLDRFLAEALPAHSRSRWQLVIDAGGVSVDGRPAMAGLRLKAGQVVEAEEPEVVGGTIEPEAMDLAVVYEDEELLVVDKPAGLVVHPGAGRRGGTLANALAHRFKDLPVAGGADRPGIVHRLDKDTSGLMLVARTERTHRALSRALAERRVERRYWGMVWGDPGETGQVDEPMGRDPRSRVRMAVVSTGRTASTRFRRTEAYGFASELELALGTGRTHQIRVHLAHIRHPVVGDPTYGGVEPRAAGVPLALRPVLTAAAKRLGRQALHAMRLRFQHPLGDGMLEFESPLPADLEVLRTAFRALLPAR